MSVARRLCVRALGETPYAQTLAAMREFTDSRGEGTPDALWLTTHTPVYTLGLNGDPAHVLAAGEIPVLRTDRGGQVTYHGPGQLVAYTLLDVRRLGLGVRELVECLERAVIAVLARHGVSAYARRDAPGVYVEGAKIASLGLKLRQGRCYHGLSLNVAGDVSPFERINPCGQAGLRVCRLADYDPAADIDTLAPELAVLLAAELNLEPYFGASEHD